MRTMRSIRPHVGFRHLGLGMPRLPKLLLIFVVDDDDGVRDALGDLFLGVGYRVSSFASAEDLLGFTNLLQVDCVISDFHMPGRSGLELYSDLRDRGCKAPFILMTAFATSRLRQEAADAGIHCVIEKPFEPEDMLGQVERALA